MPLLKISQHAPAKENADENVTERTIMANNCHKLDNESVEFETLPKP